MGEVVSENKYILKSFVYFFIYNNCLSWSGSQRLREYSYLVAGQPYSHLVTTSLPVMFLGGIRKPKNPENIQVDMSKHESPHRIAQDQAVLSAPPHPTPPHPAVICTGCICSQWGLEIHIAFLVRFHSVTVAWIIYKYTSVPKYDHAMTICPLAPSDFQTVKHAESWNILYCSVM